MPPPASAPDAAAAGGPDALGREQAVEATSLWLLGDFDASHQTLQRLETTLLDDAKVQLNLWTAGYFADAGSSLDALAAQLESWLEGRTPEREHANHTGYAVAAINCATILFLQQQHARALALLEPLYAQVDALHGGSALVLCVLLLEVYLASGQLPKAVGIIQYLHASMAAAAAPGLVAAGPHAGGNACDDQADGGGSSCAAAAAAAAPQQPAGECHKQPEQRQAEHAPPPSSAEPQPPESLRLELVSVTRLTAPLMDDVGALLAQRGGELPAVDVGALLHLYKARLAIACHNHKAAKKEVRALLACQPSNPAGPLLKAQLELMRQQPKKALKTLAPVLAAAAQCSVRCRLQLLNLLAVLHQQLGKHNMAALYLSAALTQHQQAQELQLGQANAAASSEQAAAPQPAKQAAAQGKQRGQKGKQQQKGKGAGTEARGGAAAASAAAAEPAGQRQSRWLLLDVSDALAYNLGLQQLALGNWQSAQECFEAASRRLYMQPALWLRLAEACLGVYHDAQQQQQQQGQPQPAHEQPHSGAAADGCGAGDSHADGAALLQQAAEHLATGLKLLQEQQAAAARQVEAAAAANAAAAAAAGEQLAPLLLEGAPWPPGTNGLSCGALAEAAAAGGCSSEAGSSGAAAPGAGTPRRAAAAAAAAGLLGPDLTAVRQSLLANQAYVQLTLGAAEPALAAAQELLGCSSMSAQLQSVASCYAAEALALLGRVDEARQQLQACAGRCAPALAGGGGGPQLPDAGSSAAAAATAAGSTKSDEDGSCAGGSSSRGVPGIAAAGQQAALLCNLAAVCALQDAAALGPAADRAALNPALPGQP